MLYRGFYHRQETSRCQQNKIISIIFEIVSVLSKFLSQYMQPSCLQVASQVQTLENL